MSLGEAMARAAGWKDQTPEEINRGAKKATVRMSKRQLYLLMDNYRTAFRDDAEGNEELTEIMDILNRAYGRAK